MWLATALVDALLNAGDSTVSTALMLEANCHLTTANFSENQNLSLASVAGDNEANFEGYASVDSVTWTSPVNEGLQTRKVLGSLCTFIQTGDATINTVTGYYLTTGDDSVLLAARRLDENFDFGSAGTNLNIVPAIPLPQKVANADLVGGD